VSSTAHLRSPVVFDDLHFAYRPYDPLLAYAQSKTAVNRRTSERIKPRRLWVFCRLASLSDADDYLIPRDPNTIHLISSEAALPPDDAAKTFSVGPADGSAVIWTAKRNELLQWFKEHAPGSAHAYARPGNSRFFTFLLQSIRVAPIVHRLLSFPLVDGCL
jgi:hypothetical protein